MRKDITDPAKFANGSFYLRTPKVILHSRTKPTYSFSAAGHLELLSDGAIYFQFFKHPETHAEIDILRKVTNLGGEHDHFDLEIFDLFGNAWKAYDISPSIHSGFEYSAVFSGIIDELSYASQLQYSETPDSLVIRIPYKIDYPKLNHRKFEKYADGKMTALWTEPYSKLHSREYAITISTHDSHTIIQVQTTNERIGYFTPNRILEALEFILTEEIEYCTLQRFISGKENRLYLSTHKSERRRSFHRPIQFHYAAAGEDAAKLFIKYFEYIQDYESYYRPPVHQEVVSVLRMEFVTVEAYGLSLATSIEALAKEISLPSKELNKVEVADFELIDKLLHEIQTDDIRSRLGSFFSRYSEWSEYGILTEFARTTGMPISAVRSWRYYRDTLAHGKNIDPEGVSKRNIKFNDLIALFYGLIYDKIGYVGQITNYLDEDFLIANWPMTDSVE